MEAVIDSAGRIVVPKPLRDALGLRPGTVVDISRYGSGVQITSLASAHEVTISLQTH